MRHSQLIQRKLITEGWHDPRLSLLETKYIIPFVADVERYIVEAQLTPDQISQLFTNVEQGATAAGGNRTMVGKGKDAVSFINKKIDELGAQLKQAGPVQNADAKFKELKAKIGATDSKVAKAIQSVSDWAIANPGKASIAVGVLTAAASMAGGPLGGAIGGFLARATKDLLQGADLSTAVGKAAKTGIVGALVGFGLEKIGDVLGDALAWGNDTFNPSYMTAKWDYMDTDLGSGDWMSAKLVGMPEDIEPIRDMWAEASSALEVDNYAKFDAVWSKIEAAVDQLNTPEYLASLDGTDKARAAWQAGMKAFNTMMDGVAAGAQGAAQASDDKKESIQFKPIQIETIIEWCDETPAVMLTEGPLDAIKKGASAVGGALKKGAAAVGAKAATVGKNITTKVTADKLNSAWKKAGSPTDSDAIAAVLRKAGVSDEVLAPVYKQLGATLPAAADPQGKIEPTLDPAKPGATGGQTGQAPAPKPGQTPGATGGQTGQAPAPKPGQTPGATGGQTGAPMDFKGIQQAVAKLSPADAKALVTHIDSLNKGATQAATTPPASTQQPAQANATPSAQPATQGATAAPTAPAQGQAAPGAPTKNAAAGDTYEKAKGDIRKVQSGTKPLPPQMAAGISADIAKLAKGDKESGVAAADKIMKFAQRGMDVSKLQQAWVANSKAGERFLTQSVYFEITKMLREHNLSWSDLGIRVHLLEGTNKLFGISFK
jgi:hypothetical protein